MNAHKGRKKVKLSKKDILTRGIIKENPVLVLVLGLCPALAVSTQAENAIGMGLATTFVLLGSNIVISLLRKIIPGRTRIPCYIVLIASFTVLAKMAIEAYAYTLYQSLGIFLPLIAVNCIIFARAEMFANRNNAVDSILDAIGSGVGFTIALLAIASIRERHYVVGLQDGPATCPTRCIPTRRGCRIVPNESGRGRSFCVCGEGPGAI